MENTLSPQPETKQDEMTFPRAIEVLIQGKKIARVAWNNTDYGFLNGEWLSLHKNGENLIWKVNDGDLLSTDWIIVETAN